MPVTFDYRLQIEAQGKTALGRDISFLMESLFTNTVEETNYSPETGKVVNADLNGDFVPETLLEMIEPSLREYCLRHSIVYSAVSILTYTVSTDHTDVVVLFDPSAPKKRTSDASHQIYAYLLGDIEAPPVPSDVTASSSAYGITLSWLINGHYHGVRVYDVDQNLIASLGSDTLEWTDENAEAGKLQTYYISSYHSNGESDKVKVTGRMEAELEIIIPGDDNEEPVIRKPISREEGIIKAFQSGVGDLKDLQVNPSGVHKAREVFTYSMQLKGNEEKVIGVFPRREFQYRVVAHNPYGIEFAATPWRVGIIDGKEPLNKDGAGKENLRTPLEIEVPEHETDVEYTVEIIDPSGFIKIDLDKGVPPTTSYNDDFITFSSLPESKEEKIIKTPFYGQKVTRTNEVAVSGVDTVYLEEDIPSPFSETVFKNKNISEWIIVLQSSNPNVKLSVIKEPESYKLERNFLRFTMSASIINQTQAPWNPLIHTGYYYLNQSEHYLFSETNVKGLISDEYKLIVNGDNELFVSPIPKDGSPIIVKDASGKELRQVFFYDESGHPSLEYTEEIASSERNELTLSFLDIDPATLVLSYQKSDGTWQTVTDYIIEENFIKLYPSVPVGSLMKATYRLLESFAVDYLYNPVDGYAKILLHNPVLDETNEVEVSYETGSDSYHIGNDVNLNPLKNTQNAGFLYLANEVEPCREIELQLDHHILYATGRDSTYVRVIARDRLGNPVVGERITLYSSYGRITMLSNTTDINGMVVVKYTSPHYETVDRITAVNSTSNLSVSKELQVKEESAGSHISLSTSYPVVYPGWNEVTITAHVYGVNQEPVIGTKVRFEFDSGVANKKEAVTNQFGAASIVFAATEIPRTGIIRIRAISDALGTQEDTVLRILGFRYYHPDYFMTGNNLIDVYDRVAARKNLGITAQSLAPTAPQEFDLWIDQGDMLFLQTSYQLRDLDDKQAARTNLGITQAPDAPEEPWMNDIWIDE